MRGPYVGLVGQTSQIDSSALNPLGTRAFDASGNEWIYLQGVASVAAGTAVTYNRSYATTLIAANAVGPVAFAGAAIVANKYGWFMIFGSMTYAQFAAAAVADAPLYIGGSGTVDDAVVAGDLIVGAKVGATVSGVGNGTVQIVYPFVTNTLG